MAHRRVHEEEDPGINLGSVITPMLDMSFQLLAFFIMIYHPSALEVPIDDRLLPKRPPLEEVKRKADGAEPGTNPDADKEDKKKNEDPQQEDTDGLTKREKHLLHRARLEVDEAQQVGLVPKGGKNDKATKGKENEEAQESPEGTFTLSFKDPITHKVQVTGPIPATASGAEVQQALVKLESIGTVEIDPFGGKKGKKGSLIKRPNVLVTGPPGGPWMVRFANHLAGTPPRQLFEASGAGLHKGKVNDWSVALIPTRRLILFRPIRKEPSTNPDDELANSDKEPGGAPNVVLQEFAKTTIQDIGFQQSGGKRVINEITHERREKKGAEQWTREQQGPIAEQGSASQESRSWTVIAKWLRADIQQLLEQQQLLPHSKKGDTLDLAIDAAPSVRYGYYLAIRDTCVGRKGDNYKFERVYFAEPAVSSR
jgi:hypothetical protein